MKLFKNKGPGILVAAAFIGPGTVTVCTIAGAKYHFTLLWAMVFSIIATMVLQEMAARLGLISKMGLAEAVNKQIKNPFFKWLAIIIMLSAILVGNAAYEAGNISGGVLGIQALLDTLIITFLGIHLNLASVLIGLVAFVILFIGSYKVLEKVLITLVVLMSVAFLITAIMTQPNILEVIKGLMIPSFPKGSGLIVMALIGTTVVPYNLFLHASLVQEKWKHENDLSDAKSDTYYSILFGGIISIAIIIAAAAIQSTQVSGAVDLAKGLEPLFGVYAKYFIAVGLFAAGITSAITAPLAAAYVARGCFSWDNNLKSFQFRMVWMTILSLGIVFSSTGYKPIDVIKFAQFANGLLLPIIALFLIWVMNQHALLGSYKNNRKQNLLAALIVIITILLGLKSIASVFGLI